MTNSEVNSTNQYKPEVADILRAANLKLLPQEAKVRQRLLNCRTAILGGHVNRCDQCGTEEISYNSCRDRHCPKCQYLTKMKWLQARRKELLPIQYFHVVFTVPSELNAIFLQNKKISYMLMFKAMSETLVELGNSKLNCKIGFTAILHTWGQTLVFHPHIHVIVSGGGLSLEKDKWIKCRPDYFLPQKVLAAKFKGKLSEFLEKSHCKMKFFGDIQTHQNFNTFKNFLHELKKKDWIAYCKPPFAGPAQVFKYLGQYTHRIAISNQRIQSFDGRTVKFTYKNRAQNNEQKTMSLDVDEFARRFLTHVLPNRFVKIRHYGLLGKKTKAKELALARKLLGAKQIEVAQQQSWQELLKSLTDVDICRCKKCKQGKMVLLEKIPSNLRRRRPKDSS